VSCLLRVSRSKGACICVHLGLADLHSCKYKAMLQWAWQHCAMVPRLALFGLHAFFGCLVCHEPLHAGTGWGHCSIHICGALICGNLSILPVGVWVGLMAGTAGNTAAAARLASCRGRRVVGCLRGLASVETLASADPLASVDKLAGCAETRLRTMPCFKMHLQTSVRQRCMPSLA
jgi:hypothetical protein